MQDPVLQYTKGLLEHMDNTQELNRGATLNCPTFTVEYLQRYENDVGRRSVSPYTREIFCNNDR